MAEMRLHMSEFAKAVNDAKETIADLSGQLTTTQARALQTEDENSEYRGQLTKLTNELREERERYKVVEAAAAERTIGTDTGDAPSAPVRCTSKAGPSQIRGRSTGVSARRYCYGRLRDCQQTRSRQRTSARRRHVRKRSRQG